MLFRSNRALKQGSLEVFDRTFRITAVLRLLAGLVAFLGVLSSLMALQLERSRELGVLRANGLTPGQVWELVTAQTGLMGLAAALLAGLYPAWKMARTSPALALREEGAACVDLFSEFLLSAHDSLPPRSRSRRNFLGLNSARISLKSAEISLNSTEISVNSTQIRLNSTETSVNSAEISLNSTEIGLNSGRLAANQRPERIDRSASLSAPGSAKPQLR